MGVLEILLLVGGALLIVASFVIPAKKEDTLKESRSLAKEEVKALVNEELDTVKDRVEGVVDETITYAVEKTERFMDRVSNEKIMSINEYSDTVLEQINKTHNEVMFLYDMLNEKTVHLKNTAASMDNTIKEAAQTAERLNEAASAPIPESVPEVSAPVKKPRKKKEDTPVLGDDFGIVEGQEVMDFGTEFGDLGMDNRNEEILRLHKAGKSNVAIAKELDMGVGEVKLVIGLFEGGKK